MFPSIDLLRVSRRVSSNATGSAPIRDLSQITSELQRETVDECERQPDHVRIAALDPVNEQRRPSLDGVSSGLVRSLAGGDVPLDLGSAQDRESHAGRSNAA